VIRVPAEWEKQEMVLMAFPHYNTDWSDDISSAYSIFIRIASTISYSQKLLLLVEPDSGDIVKEMFCYHNNISFIPYRVDDTWIRDYGPISIYSDDQRVLKKFIFNGWGGKFNSDRDNQAANHIYKSLYFGPSKLLEVDFILEGGSIDFDGAGTALVTSRSILTRNPHLTKNEIEAILGTELGINRFLWLDHGYLAGDDTDGHIDMLARFVSRETIVFLECLDRDDEHFQELSMMKEELKRLKNQENKPYKLIGVPMPKAIYKNSQRLPASYINFLITNSSILLPIYKDESDRIAIEIFRSLFAEREIVPIDSRRLVEQGGSIHCSTMNIASMVAS
jgi:agmatine deiminase